jgi:hypothetical protein
LKTAVQQVEGYNMGDLFDYCSKSSGLLVLLDGLDEIATSEYANMSRAINELSQLLANLSESNVLLLTMRVQFHQQVARDFEASLPMVLQLKRFSTADIYEFLTNWFAGEEKLTRLVHESADTLHVRSQLSAHQKCGTSRHPNRFLL